MLTYVISYLQEVTPYLTFKTTIKKKIMNKQLLKI